MCIVSSSLEAFVVAVRTVEQIQQQKQQQQPNLHHNKKRILSSSKETNNKEIISATEQQVQQHQQPTRKRRRTVQFSTTHECESSSSSSSLSSSLGYVIDEECQSAGWYNKFELDEMRVEAKNACRQIQINDATTSSVSNDTTTCCLASLSSMCEEKSNDPSSQTPHSKVKPLLCISEATRGLETRICMERQRRKYLVKQFILTAAKKLTLHHDSHVCKLASASSRVTRYATKIAIEEAQYDYIRAYENNSS
jgi:hypothetical protein